MTEAVRIHASVARRDGNSVRVFMIGDDGERTVIMSPTVAANHIAHIAQALGAIAATREADIKAMVDKCKTIGDCWGRCEAGSPCSDCPWDAEEKSPSAAISEADIQADIPEPVHAPDRAPEDDRMVPRRECSLA